MPMSSFWMYIWLIIGFVILIKGADIFVDGASALAKILHVPSLIIGLTIVAFGTSAPELAVSITSAIQGNNGLSVGNVIGSNIFNVLMVAGCAALIAPLNVQSNLLKKDIPFNILCSVVLIVLSLDFIFIGASENVLTRGDGIILLLMFAIFMYYLIFDAVKSHNEGQDEEVKTMPVWKCVIFTILGIAGVVLGGRLVVDSSVAIATTFGLSQTLIGLTIVAIGTSLPELVTSIVASKKGEADIAMGNVVGSNVFNLLLILGVSSAINPIELPANIGIDMLVMLATAMLIFVFAIRKKISRLAGGLMVAGYLGYTVYLVLGAIK